MGIAGNRLAVALKTITGLSGSVSIVVSLFSPIPGIKPKSSNCHYDSRLVGGFNPSEKY
jgi:hypothetical protein